MENDINRANVEAFEAKRRAKIKASFSVIAERVAAHRSVEGAIDAVLHGALFLRRFNTTPRERAMAEERIKRFEQIRDRQIERGMTDILELMKGGVRVDRAIRRVSEGRMKGHWEF
jgi:hypothetical protein